MVIVICFNLFVVAPIRDLRQCSREKLIGDRERQVNTVTLEVVIPWVIPSSNYEGGDTVIRQKRHNHVIHYTLQRTLHTFEIFLSVKLDFVVGHTIFICIFDDLIVFQFSTKHGFIQVYAHQIAKQSCVELIFFHFTSD